MTYTAFVWFNCDLRGVKTGLKLRHARKLQTLIRERASQWDVWIRPEKPLQSTR